MDEYEGFDVWIFDESIDAVVQSPVDIDMAPNYPHLIFFYGSLQVPGTDSLEEILKNSTMPVKEAHEALGISDEHGSNGGAGGL